MFGVHEQPLAVPPALKPWVAGVTELGGISTHGKTIVRLPDAASSIVICEDAHGALKVVAVGPIQRAFYKSSASLVRYTRIGFHAGRARLALGVSPRELLDGTADLRALWGKEARPLLDAVERGRTRAARSIAEVVAAELARRFEGASSLASQIVERATRLLEATEGVARLPVSALAARFHVSERFLRNAFHDELGLSPKRYARIVRIRRVAIAAASTTSPWTTLASAHGFFDQAHLSAEFRALLDTTPTAFRAGNHPQTNHCGAR